MTAALAEAADLDEPRRRPKPEPQPGRGRLVTWILIGYPVWWALGLGVLIFLAVAPMMVMTLFRQHRAGRKVQLPPGFGWWLAFLAVVVAGVAALGADPEGTAPDTAVGRMVAVLFRLGQYVALTIFLIYLGNRTALSQQKHVKLLGWLFVVTVAGGLLGTFAGNFEFTSPVEMLLPRHIAKMGFVQSLVHPSAAQVMDLIGDPKPRPAAPWGYTNTWGNNYCLLVVWFIAGMKRKVLATGCLLVSLVPVIYSLNRGLWIGLGVMGVYVAVRMALRGKLGALTTVVGAALTLGVALTVTPLGDVVNARLDNGKSNGVRMYLTERAVDGMVESPLIGFGSTRSTMGGRNSIAVGPNSQCERCGSFTIGGNGQLWQLLYAHGLLGTATYLGFFLFGLWRFRRDHSAIGIAGSAAIVASLAAMFWYNALVTPLAWTFCAYALLWRNSVVSELASEPSTQRPGDRPASRSEAIA